MARVPSYGSRAVVWLACRRMARVLSNGLRAVVWRLCRFPQAHALAPLYLVLLPERVRCRFVAPLLDSRLDPRGDPPMHALVYALPDQRLDAILGEAGGPCDAGALSRVRAEVCSAVVRCVEHVHSRRLVLVRLGPSNVVRYGPEWKILGLAGAHKEGEMLGAVRGVWEAATAPEVVRALKEDRAEGLRATRQMDAWSVGEMLYRLLTGQELMGPEDDAALLAEEEGRGRGDAQLERYLERRVDRVDDVMGKYLVENLVCIDPRDRMSLRDALLYAPQIAASALPPTQDTDSTDDLAAMTDAHGAMAHVDRADSVDGIHDTRGQLDGAGRVDGVADDGIHDMGMHNMAEHFERGSGIAAHRDSDWSGLEVGAEEGSDGPAGEVEEATSKMERSVDDAMFRGPGAHSAWVDRLEDYTHTPSTVHRLEEDRLDRLEEVDGSGPGADGP
jgi:hypothetical protein